ncbi:MAG: hypothetical protein EBZ77_14330, partial [Chitinophagia bacterium]|nr:hypothetical protein [Chitinophagia bacterium]
VRVKRNPVSNSPLTAVRPYAPANNLMAAPANNMLMNANKAMLNQPMTQNMSQQAYKTASPLGSIPSLSHLDEGTLNTFLKLASTDPDFDKEAFISRLATPLLRMVGRHGRQFGRQLLGLGSRKARGVNTPQAPAAPSVTPAAAPAPGGIMGGLRNTINDAMAGDAANWGYQIMTGQDGSGYTVPAAMAAGFIGRRGLKYLPQSLQQPASIAGKYLHTMGGKAFLPLTMGRVQEQVTGHNYIGHPLKAMAETQLETGDAMAQHMGYDNTAEAINALRRINNSPFTQLLKYTALPDSVYENLGSAGRQIGNSFAGFQNNFNQAFPPSSTPPQYFSYPPSA